MNLKGEEERLEEKTKEDIYVGFAGTALAFISCLRIINISSSAFKSVLTWMMNYLITLYGEKNLP